MGSASFNILLMLSKELMSKQASFIVESAFRAGDESLFSIPYDKYEVAQLWCNADDKVLLSRFRHRSLNGMRHSGHQDHLNQSELERLLTNHMFGPLQLPAELVTIDTNNFESKSYHDKYTWFRDQNLE